VKLTGGCPAKVSAGRVSLQVSTDTTGRSWVSTEVLEAGGVALAALLLLPSVAVAQNGDRVRLFGDAQNLRRVTTERVRAPSGIHYRASIRSRSRPEGSADAGA
jgi:hypothetical protein